MKNQVNVESCFYSVYFSYISKSNKIRYPDIRSNQIDRKQIDRKQIDRIGNRSKGTIDRIVH